MRDLEYSISHTSRRPRDNEKEGVDYHFVDRSTFGKMIDQGAFVEWAEVYGDLYGTSLTSIRSQSAKGLDVVMDLDSQGAKNIREHFEESALIYVLPPSLEVLERRLRGRGTDKEDVITRRIGRALEDLKNCVWYDYIVINDDLLEVVGEVESIVISGRCRQFRMLPRVEEMFGAKRS